jgi:DNA-binding NarL/FixJ family response regulator
MTEDHEANGAGPVRVLIADDHPIFRDGLATLLEPHPGIEVVARAADGAEAVALAAEHRPDVIVMDIQMPHVNGIEATRQVLAAQPSVGILVFTMGEDDGTLLSAMRAGARGYLVKGAAQDEVVRAIHEGEWGKTKGICEVRSACSWSSLRGSRPSS